MKILFVFITETEKYIKGDFTLQKQKLGVTATELFACNPYRILGIAVNTSADEISAVYKDLLAAAQNGSTDTYTTPFDFPSLPSFTRDEQTIRTSYVKLASNGYRCFAFADNTFTIALNVDDVALNINSISCYDCFLRCYMWLIINDREFEERALWIPLAKYIDKMIMSSPEQWDKFFDNRFPNDMNEDRMASMKSFYSTFCDIILLPIKELVRGSMKCRTAMEILNVAGISADEPVPIFDIPQANKPQPGEPEPKLKIAVKEGEEYFDVNSGKMLNFENDNTAKKAEVEHNVFTHAATKISADALITDDEEYVPTAVKPKPPVGSAFSQPKPAEKTVPSVFDQQSETAGAEETAEEFIVPKRNKNKIFVSTEETADDSASFSSLSDSNSLTSTDAPNGKKHKFNFDESITKQAQEAIAAEDSQPQYVKKPKGLSDIIDSYDQAMAEDVLEEEEESENAYADALIRMLRSNRTGSQMKSVDTTTAYDGGDNNNLISAPVTGGLKMDAISTKNYDKKRLNSDNVYLNEEKDLKKVRDAKYRDININDMLNPNMGRGTKVGGGYEIDPIEQYKKDQARQKKAKNGMWKLLIGAAIAMAVVGALWVAGIL